VCHAPCFIENLGAVKPESDDQSGRARDNFTGDARRLMGAAIGDVLGEAGRCRHQPDPDHRHGSYPHLCQGAEQRFAFLAGWLIGLAVVGGVILLIADPAGASSGSEPAVWVG
jgi:hypothetical protein